MKYLLSIAIFVLCLISVSAQDLDSLYSAFLEADRRTDKIRVSEELFSSLLAEDMLDSFLVESARTNPKRVPATIAFGMANKAFYSGEYLAAIKYARDAENNTSPDSLSYLADIYTIFCSSYQRLGQYETALLYGRKCLAIDEKKGVAENVSSSLNNLAALYLATNRADMAKQYLLRAIDLERNQDNTRSLAVRLGMLGEVYLREENYTQALEVTKEALELDRAGNRIGNMAIRLSQLGAIQLAQGNYAKAETSLLEALPLLHKVGNRTSEAITYQQLGKIEAHIGNIARAEEYFRLCIELCQKTGNKFVLQKTYQELYVLYKSRNPSKSLAYFELAQELKDSLFAEKVQRQISDFQVQYDLQGKEHQIALHEATIKRQRAWSVAMIGMAVLFLALAVLAYYYFRLTKRRNQELTEINILKDKFFSIISHDLKNPVLAQKRTLTNLSENIDALSHEEMAQIVDALLNSVTAQSDLLQNLLIWAQMQTGRMNFMPISFNVASVVDQVAMLFQLQLHNKNLILETAVPPDSMCYADKNMIITVIRNLLSNAVKFTAEGGRILLKAKKQNEKCVLELTDSGVGMSQEMCEKLFRIDARHTTTGTAGEQGTGLGMVICVDMVQKNGGTLEVHSELGHGTTFVITLPINKE